MTAEERVLADLHRETARLPPGARLPTVRELSRRHRASPVTVAAAVSRLVAEGRAHTRPGRGTFVAQPPPAVRTPADLSWQAIALGAAGVDPGGLEHLLAPATDGVIALTSGFVDAPLLPLTALASAAARAARRPRAWDRPPTEGLAELRAWFAQDAGGDLEPADVTITSGGQAALTTVFRALGRRGDPLLVESPTYVGGLAAARAAGLVPVPVPVDGDGVRPELLDAALQRTGARLIMLQPTFANPHGAVLREDRRLEILALAEAHGAFVVEDEYVRELYLGRRPPPAPLVAHDRHGHVVYIRSITKATAPSLRIAALAARGPAGERLRRARIVDDFFVSGVLQHTAVEIVTSPAWQRHLRQLRRALASRRDALIAALAAMIPEWRVVQRPAGGLCLWLRLPEGADEERIVRAAAAAGVLVLPGRPWFPAEPTGPHLRLAYAAANEQRLHEAVARLAAVGRG